MFNPSQWGARHSLAAMGFFGILNVYFSRIDLSIAIVAMVGREVVRKSNTNVSLCSYNDSKDANNSESVQGEFDWGTGSKGDLLGSYYYGYIITQIAGAYLASKIGFKITWGISMLGSSIMTLLVPVAAREGGFAALIAVRVIIGLLHGVAFPCMHAAWSVWAPPLERSVLVSAHFSGASAGTCIIFPLGGLLASAYGWPAVFYFTGTCNLLWTIAWFVIVHDSPEKHPRITPHERDYIVGEISSYQLTKMAETKGKIGETLPQPTDSNSANDVIPWRPILKSPAVFAVSLAHFTSNWGNYQMNTLLPTYLDSVLQFNLASNGFLSAVPYIFQTFATFFSGWLTDLIRAKNLISTVNIRKINTTLGHVVPGITVVIAGYVGCNATVAVIMFTISIGFLGLTVPGSKSNMLDFAPKYSGAIFAVSNTLANTSGFLAPQITGHLLDGNNSIERWQLAFWVTAIIYVPGFVTFLIFGTDKVFLPWAE